MSFIAINDNTIVNIDTIISVERMNNGSKIVTMKNTYETVIPIQTIRQMISKDSVRDIQFKPVP